MKKIIQKKITRKVHNKVNVPKAGTWNSNLHWTLAVLDIIETSDLKHIHPQARKFLELLLRYFEETWDSDQTRNSEISLLSGLSQMLHDSYSLKLKLRLFKNRDYWLWYDTNKELACELVARATRYLACRVDGGIEKKVRLFIASTPAIVDSNGVVRVLSSGIIDFNGQPLEFMSDTQIAEAFKKLTGESVNEGAIKDIRKRMFRGQFRDETEDRIKRALASR